MDVNQKRFKSLLEKTDSAFELCKQYPSSEDYAEAYEQAKSAMDQYLFEIRMSVQQKSRKR